MKIDALTKYVTLSMGVEIAGLSNDLIEQMICEGVLPAYYQFKVSDMVKQVPYEVIEYGGFTDEEPTAQFPDYEQVSPMVASAILECGEGTISHDLRWSDGGIFRHKFTVSKSSLRVKRVDLNSLISLQDEAPKSQIDLSYWNIRDYYRLDEACLLLAGIDPQEIKKVSAFGDDESDLLVLVAKKKNIAGWEKADLYYGQIRVVINREGLAEPEVIKDESDNKPEIIYLQSKFITEWAKSNGLNFPYKHPTEPHNKQPVNNASLDALFTKNNPYLSEKLWAAISVWLELVENGTGKRTPKIAAQALLDERYPKMGGRDKLAQIIGWAPEGGSEYYPSLEDYLMIRNKK
ncbi:hypothetical protein GZ77_14830 [Endozoicomonas montiporae]|uniref:Uncharacterized protein n=2 Tax=Endozoicomonas montiporae TaxID=1027273 RepID=A0A081N568_9GAMM|nr:hypothetical protein [Endozoicomonas montiporae]AMO57529.1 hypothetical protein EZMO1_3548 [Endozoicomonas montiporae CL-33]KEQ13591.1 hypothetical protein GZ77_14830 [Endozoicomonas montiporae]